MQKAHTTKTRQRSEAEETKEQQVAKKKEEVQMTRTPATKKDQRSAAKGTKTKQISAAKGTKEPIKNVKKEQSIMNTVAANKTAKAGKKETKATSTKFNPSLFEDVNKLTNRLDEETYEPGDTREIKRNKDNAYISRLQSIIQAAQADEKLCVDAALRKAYDIAKRICMREISLSEDIAEQVAQEFLLNLNKGQYQGRSLRAYLATISKSAQRQDYEDKNGFKGTVARVERALRQLERHAAIEGVRPEEISPEQRCQYLKEHGISDRASERYKNITSDMLKTIRLDTDPDEDSSYEPAYTEESYEDELYDPNSLKGMTDKEILKASPMKNPLIREMIKEGFDEDDIVTVGVYLMYLGDGEHMRMSSYAKSHIDDIFAFCDRVDLDKYDRIGKRSKKETVRETKKRTREIVQGVVDFLNNERKLKEIKQIIACLFEEAESYIRGELWNTVFDD